jgi:hypothetical protein
MRPLVPSPESYALPGDEGATPREAERPRPPIKTFQVPVATPRPAPRAPGLPSIEPSTGPARPTLAPAAPAVVERPSTPAPATVAEVAASAAPESKLAIPGTEARLENVEVHVHPGARRYKFIFFFDKEVQTPGTSYKLKNNSILVANVKCEREKLINDGDRYFRGVSLKYDTAGSKARSEKSLEFVLAFSATKFEDSSPLVDGELLQIDLKGAEWLFGRTSIAARVVRK